MNYRLNPDLISLVKNISPQLREEEYVYCTVSFDYQINNEGLIATFIESEGKTLVLEKKIAVERHLKFDQIMRCITLNVYSSLSAIGLTAVVSEALAHQSISCNMIAAFHHDHIFINQVDAEKAIFVLNNLSLE